jgi:hypothetical protein
VATNVCVPFYEPASRITGRATADVTGKRFVKVSGAKDPGSLGLDPGATGGNIKIAPAGAGDKALGVAEADCAAGKPNSVVTVLRGGFVVPIPAAVVLAPGDYVVPAAGGKAGKAAANTAADKGAAAGMVLGGGTVIDQDAIVLLF